MTECCVIQKIAQFILTQAINTQRATWEKFALFPCGNDSKAELQNPQKTDGNNCFLFRYFNTV